MMKPLLKVAMLALTLSSPQLSLAGEKTAPKLDVTQLNADAYRAIYRALPMLTSPFYTAVPQPGPDGLTVARLDKPKALFELAEEIGKGEVAIYDSLVIAHQDKLVFESYFNRGRADLPHFQASATKGYTSLAVGRAIQLGYLSMEDLHRPILDFLTDVAHKDLVAGAEKVTLHHTLSMRSGLKISDEQRAALEADPDKHQGQDLARFYLTESAPVTDQTQTYNYQGLDVQLSMLVLDAVLPVTAKAFIEKELLGKLEISNYGWREHFSGILQPGSGSYITSRDMIKFATLVKDKGKWLGEQLISRAYLDQATGSIATPVDPDFDYTNYRYGYYFWGTTLTVGSKSHDVKLAWGGGGQMAIAIDSLDLTIAVTARIIEDNPTLALLESRVLPLFAR